MMKTPAHLLQIVKPIKSAFTADFVYADGWHKSAFLDHCAERSLLACSDSEKLRLVEGSKCPTNDNSLELAVNRAERQAESLVVRHTHKILKQRGDSKELDVVQADDFRRLNTPHGTGGTKTIFERRQWAGFDEFRVRTQTDAAEMNITAPDGPRISTNLTRRAATKIADSCAYVGMERGGYSTFVTFTFTDEQRAKLDAGEVTIQKEVSRAMDSFKKVYERGMKKEGVPANNDEFDYCWVVEIPKNKHGGDNPHVHLLMRWRVEYKLFSAWAKRLESIWGHGMARIEKITDPLQAGAYMAKAAGYLTKGSDGAQGEVRGNRYGISSSARAPDWELYSETQLHIMGQLIHDVYQHMSNAYGALYRERKELNDSKDKALAIQKIAKESGDKETEKTMNKTRLQIGERLKGVRNKIKEIPARSSQYQLVINGALNFHNFIHWATGTAEKIGMERPEWLPEIPSDIRFKAGNTPDFEQSREGRKLRKHRRWNNKKLNAMDDEELSFLSDRLDSYKEAAMSCYEEYFNSGMEPFGV